MELMVDREREGVWARSVFDLTDIYIPVYTMPRIGALPYLSAKWFGLALRKSKIFIHA